MSRAIGICAGDRPDALDFAEEWSQSGHRVALATVIRTWGSSPRPVGSQLAIRVDGSFQGSVSGGCIENSVIESGLDIIRSGGNRLLHFGVSNELAWEAGLTCGGEIDIFIESIE
jgi:xanthine/CO dehydrogenase XdhC/CoxF family maturation factor